VRRRDTDDDDEAATWPYGTPEVLDTRAAAAIVGLSPATLETLRSRGGGPPFVRPGRRVVYRVADLRRWRDDRLVEHTGA
jgi:DNA-binding transcriptional MerR regulator